MTAKALEVFVGLPVVLLAAMGVLVAVGVLPDTFVVRSVLVPALALDLGPRIWWPGSIRTVVSSPSSIHEERNVWSSTCSGRWFGASPSGV